jgi:NADH:ubiquinone oxidoreductase subunit 4 (subunit M)
VLYGKKAKDETSIKESKRILIPIFILAGSLIILGLFPSIVLNLIHPVVNQFQTIIPSIKV